MEVLSVCPWWCTTAGYCCMWFISSDFEERSWTLYLLVDAIWSRPKCTWLICEIQNRTPKGPIPKHTLATCHMLGQPCAGWIERGQTRLWEGRLWAVPWLQQRLHVRQTSIFPIFLPRRTYILFSEEKKTWRSQRTQNQKFCGIKNQLLRFKRRMGGGHFILFIFFLSEGFFKIRGTHQKWPAWVGNQETTHSSKLTLTDIAIENQIILIVFKRKDGDFPWRFVKFIHGNLREPPPQCHVYPQEIAGLIKGLLTIGFHDL